MGYVVRYNRDQKRGAGGGRKKKGGLIVFTRVLRPKLRSDPELNYWNPQTGEEMNQCHRSYSTIFFLLLEQITSGLETKKRTYFIQTCRY